MELVKIIIGLISYQIEDIKKKLEVESKGNDIAYLQGKLKGLRGYNASMMEHLTLFSYWEPIQEFEVSNIKNSVLKLLVSQVNETLIDERWISISNMVDSEVEEMKDFLFNQAENARSLFITHGQRDGLFLAKKTMNSISSEYDRRVEKEKERKEDEPLLEWMKPYGEPEEVVSSVDSFEDMFIEDVEEVLTDA